jgi:hypothetical protein
LATELKAEHVLEFPYTRSTGPVLGAFFGGLRDRRVLGVRSEDGRVLVPPQEYDPVTSNPISELVDVWSEGVVETWAWNPAPRPGQPLEQPFAWVQVRLDGADTTLLHALDVASVDDVSVGDRVRIRWAAETVGSIHDIVCFEPATSGSPGGAPASGEGGAVPPLSDNGTVDIVTTPIRIDVTYRPGETEEPFLLGTTERRLLGRRCSNCHKVYLPPRGNCSMCGAPFTDEIVEVADRGSLVTWAVVNVNFAGREVDLPYVTAEVLLDGSDLTTQFLLQGAAAEDVRVGMRLGAVWREGDLQPTLSNITHVVPLDEPDTPAEQLREYV